MWSPYGNSDEIDAKQEDLYARLQRQDRHKQVVKDTDRLLKLTTEYQHEVAANGTNGETDKHLKEIEKLAREIRTTAIR